MKSVGVLGLVLVAAFGLSRLTDDDTVAAEPQDPFGYAPEAQAGSGVYKPDPRFPRRLEDLPVPKASSFAGYDCTDDCSGHEAGWEWAEQQEIADPDDCGGNSDSFIEGCIAYAEQNAELQDGDGLGL